MRVVQVYEKSSEQQRWQRNKNEKKKRNKTLSARVHVRAFTMTNSEL